MKRPRCAAGILAVILAALAPPAGADAAGLFLRRGEDGGERHAIPPEAVRVFCFEGRPAHVHATADRIAVDYRSSSTPLSGAVFDAATGRLLRRCTFLDGWPDVRPEPFGPPPPPRARPDRTAQQVVASAEFGGRTFRAIRPADLLPDAARNTPSAELNKRFGRWTVVLTLLNEQCRVEVGQGGEARRYTVADGLAGNIVTHLAAGAGGLWAACMDVWDDAKKDWGLGGLCRYDPAKDRWVQVHRIAGRPVRHVTLLQAVGGDLWVGFREGAGVVGDTIFFGMGMAVGHYRPRATAIVLARLRDGKYAAWSRPPRADGLPDTWPDKAKEPTEAPSNLAAVDDTVLLCSTTRSRRWSSGWEPARDAAFSSLDLRAGTWRLFESGKDLTAERLTGMHVQAGHVLARSEADVWLWDRSASRWRVLATDRELKNPQFGALAVVGDGLWVGYTAWGWGHSLGGRQGISRYDEKAGRWTYMPPKQLGTSADVCSIVEGPGGGVWVLFRPRGWAYGGAAGLQGGYIPPGASSRPGLGCWADGKWRFPAEVPGVPTTLERTRKGPNGIEKWTVEAPIQQIVRAGGVLAVRNETGVYLGPKTWRRIVAGGVERIACAADGKALLVFRPRVASEGRRLRHERGTCDPATGRLSFELLPEDFQPNQLEADSPVLGYPVLGYGDREAVGRWGCARPKWGPLVTDEYVPVPTTRPGRWLVGPIRTGQMHRAVETPHAVWIVSEGQLTHLDRKALDAAIARAAPGGERGKQR